MSGPQKEQELVLSAPVTGFGVEYLEAEVGQLLTFGVDPAFAARLVANCPEQVKVRDTPNTPLIVITLPLTPESQQIVEHPELFWITSMSGTAFSRFGVDVREVE